MSASNAPILDYASPRAKPPLRVGTRSVLRVQRSTDELRVVETLEDQLTAIAAMSFAWIAMTPMIAFAFNFMFREPLVAMLALILPLAGAIVTFGVIENTWGKTMLLVTRDAIVLRMISPVRKVREHRFNLSELRSAMVVTRAASGKTFDELRLEIGMRPLHLFSGHQWNELVQIQCDIEQMRAANHE